MVKHLFKFFGAAFLAMFFGLGVQVLYAQNFSYRDPTCGPNSSGAGGTWPDCNVAAPLNQGSTPQIKTGDIDLLGGDFSANTISADLVIPQILDVQTDATILGRLGVGVVAPSALLDVRGGGNILIKPTDRSGITQFGGVPNLGGLRGIATVDVHGNLNVREVPVETATGYFYQRVFADNSVFNSAYNGTTPDFSWWKTDPKIGPEFENAASWDAIKLTNSRTNSTCDDGDILDEQCDSAASIVATASAPSVAYDLWMLKQPNGLRWAIGYTKYEKMDTSFTGGSIIAKHGGFGTLRVTNKASFHYDTYFRGYNNNFREGLGAGPDFETGDIDHDAFVHVRADDRYPAAILAENMGDVDTVLHLRNTTEGSGRKNDIVMNDNYGLYHIYSNERALIFTASDKENRAASSKIVMYIPKDGEYVRIPQLNAPTVRTSEICSVNNDNCISQADLAGNGGTLITGTGTNGYIPRFTGSGVLGNSMITDNGSRIGIGTTNPRATVEVADNLMVGITNTSTSITAPTGGILAAGDVQANRICIGLGSGTDCRNAWPSASTQLWSQSGSNVYRSTGNVGIRTNSPGKELDVNGSIRFSAHLISNDDSGAFVLNSGPASLGSSSGFWFRSNNVLGNESSASGFRQLMRITADGNVGIGTTSPSQRLDVNGNITASGQITSTGLWNNGPSVFVGNIISTGNLVLRRPGTSIDTIKLDATSGKISASEYCDVTGTICSTPGGSSGGAQQVQQNGWQEIGDLLIQWGRVSRSSGDGIQNITYPKSFQGNPYSVTCNVEVNSSDDDFWCALDDSVSSGSMTLRIFEGNAGPAGVTTAVNWMAIGRKR